MEWKTIEGFGNSYQISSTGLVKSVERLSVQGKKMPEKIMKHAIKDGYLLINLRYKNVMKRVFVHRLVASAFIENKESKPCVNHMDGNRTNNNVSNLEWVTHAENQLHACRILGVKPPKRITNHEREIRDKKILEEMRMFNTFPSKTKMCNEFRVGSKTIDRLICNL